MSTYGKQLNLSFAAALPGILADLAKSSTTLNRKAQAVALEVVEIVRDRTALGIDISGRKFVKYSKEYEKLKNAAFSGKAARRLFGKGGGPLRATGRMMSSLTARNVRVLATSAGISIKLLLTFSDKERAQIAEYHDKLGAGKSKVKRPFLGLSTNTSLRKKENERLLKVWNRTR